MKKLLMTVVLGLCLMGSAHALYVTSNTANAQWSGTTTIAANTSSTSEFIATAGCGNMLLTVGSAASVTAEVQWYLNSASMPFSTEAIALNTLKQVRSTRAKVRMYSGASIDTPEAMVYCY
jgi:hypothetical protein